MARPRLELQTLLESKVGAGVKVYFQPPSSVKMEYPCVRYAREGSDTTYADNLPYQNHKRYSITVIDRDPDSAIPDKIASLPSCTHNRFFAADNLNHDVYTLYF